jgi:hypothetical protein
VTARKPKPTTETVELPHGLTALLVLRDPPNRRTKPKPPPPDPTLDEGEPW